MGWKVGVEFEIVTFVSTNKLSLLDLIGTFMSKALISDTLQLISFRCSHFMR